MSDDARGEASVDCGERMQSASRTSGRLHVSILWGGALGVVYTVVDALLDRFIGPQVSEPPRLIELFHAVIDLVLPTLTGVLLGVAAHYVRLRAKMAELERERADALVGRLSKIERDQAVWVISASLLHEIKNPLHSLGLLLDEALDCESPTEAQEQKRLLDRARAQVDKIEAQVSALRAVPTIASPDVPPVSLARVVDAAVKTRLSALAEAGIVVTTSGLDQLVEADASYLRVILETLLDNAIDVLSERRGGNINISADADGDRVSLSVQDNGPGVELAVAPYLFEPLHSTKAEGLGLGLAIARSLARSMSGDLSSAPSAEGACFLLQLKRGAA